MQSCHSAFSLCQIMQLVKWVGWVGGGKGWVMGGEAGENISNESPEKLFSGAR